jgi:hypothetical protein
LGPNYLLLVVSYVFLTFSSFFITSPKLVGAGITCSFVSVEANAGEILKILDSSEQRASTSTTIGLFCEGDFYDLEGDLMWDLSRIFLNVALTIASLAVIIAWSISTFVLPTKRNWKLISITSALSAVVQVPIFLVFETEPCKDFPQQQCELSKGCYLLMGSVICSVFVTILTVCLDPPDWVGDLDTWRLPKSRTADSSVLEGDEDGFLHSPVSPSEESSSSVAQLRHWPLWKTRPKTPLAANPSSGSMQSDGEGAPAIRDFGWKASENDEFMVLPARADLESAPARSVSSSVKYGARPEEESRIGASSQITGDESVLDANESNEHEELETAATENMVAAAPTVATFYSAAITSVGGVSDVELNTVVLPKLQQEQNRPAETEAPVKIPSDDRNDRSPPKANPILGFASRVLPERRRRNRAMKGYAFLDDDDTDSSLPMSPPLEVIVSIVKHDDDHDLAAIHSAHEDDQDLLDDWNVLHNYLPAPVGDKVSRSPDPLVLSSDDDSDISDPEDEDLQSSSVTDPVDSNNPTMHVTAPRDSPRLSTTKRRRKLRSTNSVTSGTSLLDLTIEEETAVDLQEFESDTEEKYEPVKLVRQRSAPNLAAFHSRFSNREKVCEEVHMEGLNSYHRVETFRSTGPASQRMGRSRSLTPLKGIRRLVSRSPSPAASLQAPKKVPLWKEEREFRGGIHNQVSFSSDSGDENQSHATSPTLVSRAREARMKRLQRASPTKSIDTTPTRKTTRTLDVLINPSCVSPDDTGSTLLDTIDLQLAKVQRPDGAEYGPDEVSL